MTKRKGCKDKNYDVKPFSLFAQTSKQKIHKVGV